MYQPNKSFFFGGGGGGAKAIALLLLHNPHNLNLIIKTCYTYKLDFGIVGNANPSGCKIGSILKPSLQLVVNSNMEL
jgi:hypothetical protein